MGVILPPANYPLPLLGALWCPRRGANDCIGSLVTNTIRPLVHADTSLS